MFFTLGQRAITLLLKTYFKQIEVKGAGPLGKGPILIAGNHPNMALDPLLLLGIYPRPLFFLAKSTLFRNPVASCFLRACHLIPVYRRADRLPSESNDKTFDEVCHHLEHQRAVAIFPEGTSIGGRTVLKLKTGTARMAFFAEEQHNWSLGVHIQPVGITYAHFLGWNSSVAITVGDPIRVADFRELYERDPSSAVRHLTDSIEFSLKRLTVHVDQAELAPLINAIHQLFTRSGRITEVDTKAFAKIAKAVATLAPLYPERAADFLTRARILLSLPLSGEVPRWFIATIPLVVTGITLHLVPYELTRRTANSVSPDNDQLGMYTFFSGAITFVLWYALLTITLMTLGFGLLTPVALIIMAAIGLFTARTLPLWRLLLLSLVLPSSVRALTLLQEELINEMLVYAERVTSESDEDDGVPGKEEEGLIH